MHITFSPAGKPVRCCNIHTTYAKTVHLFAAAKACHLERRELLLNHLDFRCAEEQGKEKMREIGSKMLKAGTTGDIKKQINKI